MSRLPDDRILRLRAAAASADAREVCALCGEPGAGDLAACYDEQGYVATLHFDTCRPSVPTLRTDFD